MDHSVEKEGMSFVKVNLRRPLLIAGMAITAKPASPDAGPHASDVAAFDEEALADLLERPGPDSAAARRALEQLRARLRARDVVIWLVAGDRATPAPCAPPLRGSARGPGPKRPSFSPRPAPSWRSTASVLPWSSMCSKSQAGPARQRGR